MSFFKVLFRFLMGTTSEKKNIIYKRNEYLVAYMKKRNLACISKHVQKNKNNYLQKNLLIYN